MANISIYLTNLGKYNEGELVGEWVELPVSDEELAEVLKRIGINEHYEEYFITDYESDIDGFMCGEYDSITELNEIAEAFEDYDAEQIEAALYFSSSLEKAVEILEDICYITTPKGWETDEEAIGWYYVHECGCLEIPEHLENYFDYERYGRDIMLEGNFYTAESGHIYELRA